MDARLGWVLAVGGGLALGILILVAAPAVFGTTSVITFECEVPSGAPSTVARHDVAAGETLVVLAPANATNGDAWALRGLDNATFRAGPGVPAGAFLGGCVQDAREVRVEVEHAGVIETAFWG